MDEFIKKLIERLKAKHIPYLGMDNSVPYGTEMIRLFDAIEIVNQLAEEYKLSGNSEQLNGWIPCSEMLPEENKRYITTSDVCGDGEIETFDLYFDDGVWFVDKGCEAFLGTVIAWQPLPPKYEPKQSRH